MTPSIPTRMQVRRAFYEAKPREQRLSTVTKVSLRAAEDGAGAKFTGYASVTNQPYDVNDWLGTYSETMSRGCFGKSLQEQDDVRLLVNHDGIPLARTSSGTLSLREVMDPDEDPQGRGQTGLWCESELDLSSPLVRTVQSAMDRGDLAEMSFAFSATRQEWNEDYTERFVRECKLFDASVVTYPASPTTSAQLNSAKVAGVAARLKQGRALDAEDVNVLTQTLGWLSAIDSIVDEAQESLADYLKVPNPDEDDAPEPADDAAAGRAAVLKLMRLRSGLIG